MKITLGELRDSRKALDVLFNKELKDLEDFRLKLIKKYGEQDKDKNAFSVKDDKQADFYAEFGKLLDTEVDIKFSKIPITELGDIKITPSQLALLDPFIKEK